MQALEIPDANHRDPRGPDVRRAGGGIQEGDLAQDGSRPDDLEDHLGRGAGVHDLEAPFLDEEDVSAALSAPDQQLARVEATGPPRVEEPRSDSGVEGDRGSARRFVGGRGACAPLSKAQGVC